MIRQVDLVSYLPPYLQNYKEQVAALAAEDPEFLLVWDAVNGILYNHFISTANEYGISRYEKILGIKSTEGDNLESRRTRVQVQWVNLMPYTIRTFVQKLKILCGDSPYIVNGNFRKTYELSVITYLKNIGQVNALDHLLETMVPCNLAVHSENKIAFSPSGSAQIGLSLAKAMVVEIESDPNLDVMISGSVHYGNSISIHRVLSTE